MTSRTTLLKNLKKKDVKKLVLPEKERKSASETVSPYFIPSSKQNVKTNKLKNEKEKIANTEEKKNKSESKLVNKVIATKTESAEWEPSNWKEIFENIRIMRSQIPAPVDTMGCDKCGDENLSEKEKRFNVLLSLMLSTRTKDEITYEAMGKLKQEISPLSPENILKCEAKNLEQLLKPVAFYRNKANFLIKTSKILIEKYDSDIPKTADELMNLPGISSKIAHICTNVAWNTITGIGVDTHVHRISNRLKWVKQESKTPEKTRIELESWLPRELWGEVNHLLVGFGQTICKAISPKCDSCLNKQLCPYNNSSVKNKKKGNKEKTNMDW